MSIDILTGYIGGGKSYTAVNSYILDYLARGGVVLTNIPMRVEPDNWQMSDYVDVVGSRTWQVDGEEYNAMGIRELLRREYSWELQEGQLRDLRDGVLQDDGAVENIPAGDTMPVLVVIDEAADFFDSMDWKSADRSFLSMVRHSRKLKIDMVFIVQELTELNKRIRNQCKYVTRVIDIDEFRIPGIKIGLRWIPWMRNTFRVCRYHRAKYDTEQPGEPIQADFVPKDPRVYSCYETNSLHTDLPVKMGETTDYSGEGNIEGGQGMPWSWGVAGTVIGSLVGVLA